jgi:hypothetical protein
MGAILTRRGRKVLKVLRVLKVLKVLEVLEVLEVGACQMEVGGLSTVDPCGWRDCA